MKYILTAEGLTKEYRKTKALDDFSMHIPEGAIYGFVGENGAGKTTLIRTVLGLQKPTSGTYTLYGVDGSDREIEKIHERIGAVVESPAIYQGMSAEDNLRHQYYVMGMPSRDGIKEILELVGLADAGRKKAKNFSLGMRQRLGIAVALCGSPDFLVLDEPTNGLDPQGIIEMREMLLRLNREKQITILISSHNLDELSKIATHYGFIAGGRMVREISAEELEKEFRRSTVLTVTDTGILSGVLDNLGIEYEILSDNEAKVYGEIPVSEVSLALAEEKCSILSMHEQNETLESYYINLLGGGRYE